MSSTDNDKSHLCIRLCIPNDDDDDNDHARLLSMKAVGGGKTPNDNSLVIRPEEWALVSQIIYRHLDKCHVLDIQSRRHNNNLVVEETEQEDMRSILEQVFR